MPTMRIGTRAARRRRTRRCRPRRPGSRRATLRRGGDACRRAPRRSRRAAPTQREVGLAVDGAHGGAELGERRRVDQVHRERERDAEHHREQRGGVAPRVVAQLGPRELAQQRDASTRRRCAMPVGVSVTLRSARAAAARECVAAGRRRRARAPASTSSVEHALGGGRVEVAGRLVGEDQLRPVHQRARDRDALQLAARQRLRQARRRSRRGRPRRASRATRAGSGRVLQQQRQADVVRRRSGAAGRGRPGTRSRGVRAGTPPAPARRALDVGAGDAHRPASTRVEPGGAVEQRRLADARLADDGDELAGARTRSTPSKTVLVAVALGEPGDREDGLSQPAFLDAASACAAATTRSIASARVAGDDLAPRHRAQPGQLALGELARRRGRARAASAVEVAGVERRPRLAIADGAHRRQVGMQVAARAQRAHLVDEARPRASPRSARAMRACSQARSRGSSAISGGVRRRRRALCHADSGRPLTRCTSSARWMRCASFGARRAAVAGSTRASSACSAGQPSRAASRVDRGAHRGVGRRHRVEAVEQRLEVQHRAADEQRQRAARADRRDRRARVGDEARRRVALGRIDDVDQVVRHGGALGARSAWRCRCPCRDRRAPNRR